MTRQPERSPPNTADKYSVLCQRYSQSLRRGGAYPLPSLLPSLPAENRPDFLAVYLSKRLENDDLPTLSALCAEYQKIKPILIECYPQVPIALRLPAQLGNYEVVKFVASGNYARTVVGKKPDGTRVLIKYHWLQKHKGLLRREFELLSVCQHKHIRAAIDADLDYQIPYIVLEYVDGSVLTRRYNSTQLAKSIKWLRDICAAVSHMHAQEKFHHDIKPDNIIIGNSGAAKLIDFGFAVEEYLDGQRQQAGAAIGGTTGYMAPEKLLQRADADSKLCDVFALGATLFFVLTGKHPPPVLQQDAKGQPTSKLDWKPSFKGYHRPPKQLAKLCLSAMELDPVHRCTSAGIVFEELSSYLRWRLVKPVVWKALAPSAIAAALVMLPPLLGPKPLPFRDASDGVPAWYHEMAAQKGFSLAEIGAEDLAFSLRKARWVENPNAELPHINLVVEPTDIHQDLIGYMQMRTGPRSEWRTVLMDAVKGNWYWSLSAEDYASTSSVEVRFKNPINDPSAEILGPYVTDFRLNEAVAAYKADIKQEFDKLLKQEWVEYVPDLGWRYNRAFRGPTHTILSAVAAGTRPNELIDNGNIMGLGGLASRVAHSPTIYVQLISLAGEKSEVRKFEASAAAQRPSSGGGIRGGSGGGI